MSICHNMIKREFELHDGDLVNSFTMRIMTFIFWKYFFDDSVSGELEAEDGGQSGSHCSSKQ